MSDIVCPRGGQSTGADAAASDPAAVERAEHPPQPSGDATDGDQPTNVDPLSTYAEIQPDRLYFVALAAESVRPRSVGQHTQYFCCDDDYVYENFFADFGPLNVCQLQRYCVRLQRKLAANPHRRLVHYTTLADPQKRLNAAYLCGAFAVLCLRQSVEQVLRALCSPDVPPFIGYCDASYGASELRITLADCLHALHKAHASGFVRLADFDATEYEHYELVEHGDLNWIVPGKFLAFSGPHDRAHVNNGYVYHAPETYFAYFRRHNVRTVVRLNVKMYDARRFAEAGFEHVDMYFVDGSTPSDGILKRFLAVAERTDGALAVHCKAGLGRTGSLICAYVCKHYGFSATEAIAWVRLCRPGSVIGHQQQWLIDKEAWLWTEGDAYRRRTKTDRPRHAFGIYSVLQRTDPEHLEQQQRQQQRAAAAAAAIVRRRAAAAAAAVEPPASCAAAAGLTYAKPVSPAVQLRSAVRRRTASAVGPEQPPARIADRVRNIAEKLDAIRMGGDAPAAANGARRRTLLAGQSAEATAVGQRTTRSGTRSTSGPDAVTTQGDTLKQIKAMRRRHSRSVYATIPQSEHGLSSSAGQPPMAGPSSQRSHVRAKSQPLRAPIVGQPAVQSSAGEAGNRRRTATADNETANDTNNNAAPADRQTRIMLYKRSLA